ncbi:unnamed protein product [Effrenium voratum]|nr:unnamed protein product [Effrenium voratum]
MDSADGVPDPLDPEATKELPEANEIIEGLWVGSADAGTEATVGPNSRQIAYVLNVGGCVTPVIFAALARAIAEEGYPEDADEDNQELSSGGRSRGHTYTHNGVETLALPMDDYGRTPLTEDLLSRLLGFIEHGLQARKNAPRAPVKNSAPKGRGHDVKSETGGGVPFDPPLGG